jgi:hypothetical protein
MECWSAAMVKKKSLLMLTVWSVLIAVPSAQGRDINAPDIYAGRIQSFRPYEINRQSIVMAQNEHQGAESQSRPADENKNQGAQPQAAGEKNAGKHEDNAGAKPLKPFKPSEEIAAEQAVDFPVDI